MNESKFIARNHALLDKPRKRSWLRKVLNEKFSIYDIWDVLPRQWRYRYWDTIGPFIEPQNCRFRKVIPRRWSDISSLIETVNFEFVKGFYEDEYLNGTVNWDAFPEHREFADWLEATYRYITVERPQLEKDLENAYPPSPPIEEWFEPVDDPIKGGRVFKMKDDGLTYEEKYGEVNRIEAIIDKKDTEILTEIVKRRQFFWS
jgi:hypothetical protein